MDDQPRFPKKRAVAACLQLLPAVLLFAACRQRPADPPRNAPVEHLRADTFSVAFYNVENLFDNEFDGDEYVEYRPGATNWNREMHDRKFDHISSALAALDASVIALCEVEDRDALNRLQEALKGKNAPYRYKAIVDSPALSNTCPALLSRFPVERYAATAVSLSDGLPTRAILEAQIDVGGTPLTLFVNHWPSKHHRESYRLAAAKALCNRIGRLAPGRDYLILGDFNSDYDEFSTFTTFGQNDSRDSTGVNHCLGTVRGIGAGDFRPRTEREMIAAPFPSHYDLWLELDDRDRMSYFYRGNRQTPDHIILPPSMYDSSGISYLDNSFRAFTWDGRLLSNGRPLRWKINYRGKRKYHAGEGYSDHLPVSARFVRGPFRFAAAPATGRTVPADADTVARPGWFEYHSSGWVACGNGISIGRDTAGPYAGSYSLHVTARPQKNNGTAASTIVRPSDRAADGSIILQLRGSGSICLRTRASGEKWRYHNLADGGFSGRANYAPFSSASWHPVCLRPSAPHSAPVELELRSGKETALDLFIDR